MSLRPASSLCDGRTKPASAAIAIPVAKDSSELRPRGRPASAPRYAFIDALRGLAALAVAAFHARAGHHIDRLCAAAPPFVSAVLGRGDVGVDVFFVLSGVVIAHSMCPSDVTSHYVGRFLLRRSIRLDPPYWASMALVVGLGAVSSRVVASKAFAPPTLGVIAAHVFYLQDLLGIQPLNSIYWTLCLEIQFYVVFSLLMLLATRLRRHVTADVAFYAVVVPATVVADLWPLRLAPFEVAGLFVKEWHLFVVGVWVWWAGVARPGDRAAAALGVGEILALTGAALAWGDLALGVGVGTGLAILLAARLGKLTTWLSARPFQALGAISYSFYLVHNPISGAAFRVGYSVTGHTAALEGLWLVVALGLSIGFAYLFYRLVERPSQRLSRTNA